MLSRMKRFAVIVLLLGAAAAAPATLRGSDNSCGCPEDMGLPYCCDCRAQCSGDGVCVETCGGCVADSNSC